jgi:hypothetical protein
MEKHSALFDCQMEKLFIFPSLSKKAAKQKH